MGIIRWHLEHLVFYSKRLRRCLEMNGQDPDRTQWVKWIVDMICHALHLGGFFLFWEPGPAFTQWEDGENQIFMSSAVVMHTDFKVVPLGS